MLWYTKNHHFEGWTPPHQMSSSLQGVFYQYPLAGGCYLAVSCQTLASVCKVSNVNLAADSDLLDTQRVARARNGLTTTIRQSFMKHPNA